jgi:hypothetical protein
MNDSPPRTLAIGMIVCACLLIALPASRARAVPSFARQVGVSCGACHTVFPQLTPFGRWFKLHGYTMAAQPTDDAMPVAYVPPLAVMMQTSYTSLKKKQPDTQNDNFQLPDQLSLFYAGRVTSKLGAFLQVTYDGVEDHFSLDNTDIRFADDNPFAKHNLLYGLTVNNNPTVQDVWNSTPAWGFPFASSGIAPTPTATTQLDGPLAQQVAGLGAYGQWDDWLYAELTGYRSSQIGNNQPPDQSSENTIKGIAPYWRLALEHGWEHQTLEVGTYGMDLQVRPQGVNGPTNDFLDLALDAQYQYLGDPHTVTLRSTWIHERQRWNAGLEEGTAANRSDNLDTFGVNVSYYYRRRYGGTLGYFSTWGDRDRLLYAPDPVDGSRTGKPNSDGWIAELDYVPWPNVKLSLQYVGYNKFNGASSNYDGAGRDASDNNTLYANLWINF